jgi:hypothetical protein
MLKISSLTDHHYVQLWWYKNTAIYSAHIQHSEPQHNMQRCHKKDETNVYSFVTILRSQSSAPGFVLFAYCCIPLQPPQSYVNQPKAFVIPESHCMIVTIHLNKMARLLEYKMLCWTRKQPLEGYAESVFRTFPTPWLTWLSWHKIQPQSTVIQKWMSNCISAVLQKWMSNCISETPRSTASEPDHAIPATGAI